MADEELEPVELESEESEEETTTEAADEDKTEGAEAEDEGDEVIVSIGEETPPPDEKESAPEWVRELRKKNREDQRKIRELEEKLKAVTVADKPADLGKKPTLEDFDYDSERFEQELESWFERKREHDARQSSQKAAEEKQQQEWQAKLDEYQKSKAALKVKDFDDYEEVIRETFDTTQMGVVIHGSDKPALLVAALGRNPTKARELASIKDPVKFAFAIAKLEDKLKVTNRKAAPPPEKTVRGNAAISGSVDSTLERLREEAAKTGDFSKVNDYKRKLRAKA